MLLLAQQMEQMGLVLSRLVGYFLVLVVYCLIGCILSAPYTFLAGGNSFNFFLGTAFMPMIFLFLLVFWKVMRLRHRQYKWGGSALWIIVAYFCLPIILNGGSILLKSIGYETISHYVFAGRYFSLWAIPAFLAVCGVILVGITDLRQRFSKNSSAG